VLHVGHVTDGSAGLAERCWIDGPADASEIAARPIAALATSVNTDFRISQLL
jgi:hypothetical protein